LFIGRISPEKRLDRAIEIARRSGRPIKVAAKIYDEDRAYYQEIIEPILRGTESFVEFVGEVGGKDKDELIGNAYALLFPIDWPEPFGLVMIEALACGTPVIAWRNGSVPEVIENGLTGCIVESIDDAVRAVGNAGSLSRAACRASFAGRFDSARMASNYEQVYERLVRGTNLQMQMAEPTARHRQPQAV
jgi:glycosyltransferase involved in cell wall biosynthesis